MIVGHDENYVRWLLPPAGGKRVPTSGRPRAAKPADLTNARLFTGLAPLITRYYPPVKRLIGTGRTASDRVDTPDSTADIFRV
ncbi:MAG: hypothetical protein MZV63_46930 [Marinilabiliales bacterium]|nr:hypothetical protein [Marinilabiliales bacterium]